MVDLAPLDVNSFHSVHSSKNIGFARLEVARFLSMPKKVTYKAGPLDATFINGLLYIPGYAFSKVLPWQDVGSTILIAEGRSLQDNNRVLAKIANNQTNACLGLEREADLFRRMSESLRVIDFFTLSKIAGDCVVLLTVHPGVNSLGRIFPASKVNELLFADASRLQPPPARADIYSMGIDEYEDAEYEALDVMDLASFLEFAIQATQCLEVMHKMGATHREVRANAFHMNDSSGIVRLVHLGNRSNSLEKFGGPAPFVIQATDEMQKQKIKEAMCYLAPEQTGTSDVLAQDHRTDLYSLGILFWSALVGRGILPFECPPIEMLRHIALTEPPLVSEMRRDVPIVLSSIVDKLLVKNSEGRYQSAYGLKSDLLECQRRLMINISAVSENVSDDLIPLFNIGCHDKYSIFSIPNMIFGREKELEVVRRVAMKAVRNDGHITLASGAYSLHSTSSQVTESSDSLSTRSISSHGGTPNPFQESTTHQKDNLRRVALSSRINNPRVQAVILVGSGGTGKTSIVQALQSKWRAQGVWAYCKFQAIESAPYASLLACLSSALRQLKSFDNELQNFVASLKQRLPGVQIHAIHLLPVELRDILDLDVNFSEDQLAGTRELRARFINLVQEMFIALAETRMFALILDDLHEADESAIDLIENLINVKSRLLILATTRDGPVVPRLRGMLSGRAKATWLQIQPLPFNAISQLVSTSLRRTETDAGPLSRLLYTVSSGNAFIVRNLLTTFYRQRHISFDAEHNYWKFDTKAIESDKSNADVLKPDRSDFSFLLSHLHELPEEPRMLLTWAALFGQTFKLTEVLSSMDQDSSSGSEGEETDQHLSPESSVPRRSSMQSLQRLLVDGWIVQRSQEIFEFSHDRYRQAAEAEAASMSVEVLAQMSLKIVLMLLHEQEPDIHAIAEHGMKCIELLKVHAKSEELLNIMIDAGESAWSKGALESALRSFNCAKSLIGNTVKHHHTFLVLSRLAALLTWSGQYNESDIVIADCLKMSADSGEERAKILRLRANNQWYRNRYADAIEDTIEALRALGIEIDKKVSQESVDTLFNEIATALEKLGFDQLANLPRAPSMDLAIALLNDAGINAVWADSPVFSDTVALTIIKIALEQGVSPGTGAGCFWLVSALAENRGMYEFTVNLSQAALRLNEVHGTPVDKCRTATLYPAFVAGFGPEHIRNTIPMLEESVKQGLISGDSIYTAFASLHTVQSRFATCEHLNVLLDAAEECVSDCRVWTPGNDSIVLAMSFVNVIRAIGGLTYPHTLETVFDTNDFREADYADWVKQNAGNVSLTMNWYNSYKLVGLFCTGYHQAAAELGFYVWSTRMALPNHWNVRFGLHYHSLAMIATLREEKNHPQREQYMAQVELNQTFMRRWITTGSINVAHRILLVDAELASLTSDSKAFMLYDKAVKLAIDNNWLMDEGFALFLQGQHFVREGVQNLGEELQQRAMQKQAQWGAHGIVQHWCKGFQPVDISSKQSSRVDAAIQTELRGHFDLQRPGMGEDRDEDHDLQREMTNLGASDLASVLQWSKDISSDMNLSSALQRLTEILCEASRSQNTFLVLARELGDFVVATRMGVDGLCHIHDDVQPISTLEDALQERVVRLAIDMKETIWVDDVSLDDRFKSQYRKGQNRSVLCIPLIGNRGHVLGAASLSSPYSFTRSTATILSLLCQQASISIANAILFRSVQAGTRDNLRMINAQKSALETARRSREDALRATKIKSNFLASMSHELRTPFSSFYGLLDLLTSTPLTQSQSDIVQTAKQSCELLLKIIDSILDYSKLEASAVKLDINGFFVESIMALGAALKSPLNSEQDCMELILPTAVKKLDLAYNIDSEVPKWVSADYARIRQVLMNLIGNSVKFTQRGAISVVCAVHGVNNKAKETLDLKFTVTDTGIGLAPSDVDMLFKPFVQADNSSTRAIGGTGLGLSICKQLVTLMKGSIGVNSLPGEGSTFWFIVPVQRFSSRDSQQAMADIERLTLQLSQPQSMRVLLSSQSPATLSLLSNMLNGFHVETVTSVTEARAVLQDVPAKIFDVIVIDEQSEDLISDIAMFIKSSPTLSLNHTMIVHLYTPTTNSFGRTIDSTLGLSIIKLTKPPRTARLLNTLASIRNLPTIKGPGATTDVSKAMDDLAAAQRTLYGNVLIAEDNEIAQTLLVKQLQKLDLNVTATNNGEEALQAWQAREPGYFALALFDHHMPILDGVQAARRLRQMEAQQQLTVSLPIVALSADCQESTKQLCLSAGMNSFLSKPLKKHDMQWLLSTFGGRIGPQPRIETLHAKINDTS